MNHRQLSPQSGFTLVEIIIVVIILISMTGFISGNYAMFTEEKKLLDATTTVRTVLNQARNRAINGDLDRYPCDPFYGYQVSYDTASPQQYQMRICCNQTCELAPSAGAPSYEIGTYTMPSNILFVLGSDHETTDEPFSVRFQAFAQGTEIIQNGIETEVKTIIVKNSFIGTCNWITVSPIGVIDQGRMFFC